MTKALKSVTTVLTVWEVLTSFMGLDTEMVHKLWELCKKLYVQKKEDSPDHPDPTPSLEKKDVLRQAYDKYAREDGHHPESYRVLKTLYERHIEGKHVPFQRYVINPEEREEIENDKQLPTSSRAFVQDARRTNCIAMLDNIFLLFVLNQ